MSRRSAAPVYEDMARAAEEIKGLTARAQELQTTVFEKDNELITLSSEGNEVHDIGTFKFVAESVGLPLDTVVKIFILCIVLVFDPLAVALVLAYNIATRGSVLKEAKTNEEDKKKDSPKIIATKVFVPTNTPPPPTPTVKDVETSQSSEKSRQWTTKNSVASNKVRQTIPVPTARNS
jgi:hypothetical protein